MSRSLKGKAASVPSAFPRCAETNSQPGLGRVRKKTAEDAGDFAFCAAVTSLPPTLENLHLVLNFATRGRAEC